MLNPYLANLPVRYQHSTNARMTAGVYWEWFLDCFLREIGDFDNHIRIQFILDNRSVHSIELEFRPKCYYEIFTT